MNSDVSPEILATAPSNATGRRKLRVSVIGGIHLSWGGREVQLRNRKARALLAYLALGQTGHEQREKLAGLFWSEFSEQNARATLRQAVHELREALAEVDCHVVTATRPDIVLEEDACVVDLHEILAALQRREAHEALLGQERVAEVLLAGYEDLDPAFRVWLLGWRHAQQERLLRGLEDAYRHPGTGWRQRRKLAEAMLLLDPSHEEACRTVMRAAAEAGETGAALRAYDALYRLLGDEYDMEPSAATQELVAEIKQGRFDVASATEAEPPPFASDPRQAMIPARRSGEPVVAPAPAKPALFIESFAASGVAPSQVHLIDGFRMELIACLTHFREWYVADSEIAPPDGVALSARFALVTTAYQAGSVISVVMVLQERPSSLAIWGERFELNLESWFETQQRIVRKIAATLNVQLSTERLLRLSHVADVSLETFDLWLRGQWLKRNYSATDWNRAAEMFAKGIEKAPGFSPFYSSLAQMYNGVHFVQPGMMRDPGQVARTLQLAQQAVALDPRDSRAELCLGWAYAFSRRYAQAELHMDLACGLNDNDPWTLTSAAMFFAFCGDDARAGTLAAQAMELSLAPTATQWLYEISIRFLRGDHQGAVDAADRVHGSLLTVPAWRAMALARLGRRGEALADVRRFYADVGANWVSPEPPTQAMICRWFLQVYPISDAARWRHLRDSLAGLGMPVEGLVHTCAPLLD
jgi:DNA-binding SARP family transcriptional activator/TolB-like protein